MWCKKKRPTQRVKSMRNSTKLKHVLLNNTVTMSLTTMGVWEAIVTNNSSGNSHLCQGGNFTQLIESVVRDTKCVSTDENLNF